MFQGRLSAGIGVAEARGVASMRLRGVRIPDTAATAAIGRQMGDLVSSPVFRRPVYPILTVEQDDEGLSIGFGTPDRTVPVGEALAARRR